MPKLSKILFYLLLLGISSVLAQEGEAEDDNNQQQRAQKVIELEAQILDARAELPQVQILDTRKSPDFEEVKVEKSFRAELSGKTEELKYTPITSNKIKQIKNIDALLNKKRF
ncbi:MAG: hypothetical protein GWN00_00375 [Aliifodinibius sp.]|nr:hypothetical protein [Fodinibius sp.]NIV09793.1 hypothetical protein [Fodinibius sp.]NIY23321.1 hypothetical protein [Fodinibius sp.]